MSSSRRTRNRFDSRDAYGHKYNNYGFNIRSSTDSRENVFKSNHTPGEWLDTDSEPDYDRIQDPEHDHDHSRTSQGKQHNTRKQPLADRHIYRHPVNRYHGYLGSSEDERCDSSSTIPGRTYQDYLRSLEGWDEYQSDYLDDDHDRDGNTSSDYVVEEGMSEGDVQRYRKKRQQGYHTHGRGFGLFLCDRDCETYNERAQDIRGRSVDPIDKDIPPGKGSSDKQAKSDVQSQHNSDDRVDNDGDGEGSGNKPKAAKHARTERQKDVQEVSEDPELSDIMERNRQENLMRENHMRDMNRAVHTRRKRCMNCGSVIVDVYESRDLPFRRRMGRY